MATQQTTSLAAFLLAQIDADEAAAREVLPLGHVIDMGGARLDERWYVARLRFSSADGAAQSEQDAAASELFARHDPAHVLATCAAHRAIVELAECVESYADRDALLRALALAYADRPGFDPAWVAS